MGIQIRETTIEQIEKKPGGMQTDLNKICKKPRFLTNFLSGGVLW
jgi:hypothetical protein